MAEAKLTSTKMDILEYINDRLLDQAAYHSKTAADSQRVYRRLKNSAIVLSALTPLLLAFNLLLAPPEKNVVQYVITLTPITLAVASTVVQALLSTHRYRQRWTESRATKEALDQELYPYRTGAGPYADDAARDGLLVERTEQLIGGERESWMSAQLSPAAQADE